MTDEPFGGLLDRLVCDSVFQCVKDGLAALGWFDAGRQHDTVWVRSEPWPKLDETKLNTVVVQCEDIHSTDAELGSNLSIDGFDVWVDIYGESAAISKHLAGDVRDILRGKIASIGRDRPIIDIMDWRLATPTKLGYVEVDDVEAHKGHAPTHQFQQNWIAVSATCSQER